MISVAHDDRRALVAEAHHEAFGEPSVQVVEAQRCVAGFDCVADKREVVGEKLDVGLSFAERASQCVAHDPEGPERSWRSASRCPSMLVQISFQASGENPARTSRANASAAVASIVYLTTPLHGIVDVRPELASIVAREERTADMYRSAVGRYTRHQLPVDTAVLIALIDDTILPQLSTSRTEVAALTTPLVDHQRLIEGAAEYLRLRETSWRLRAEALRKRNMTTLRNAEEAEQQSLRALEKLRRMRTAM